MKVICYGDSNTYGYDPHVPFGGRYPSPWPELLAEMTGWRVINQGENGREIPKIPVTFPMDTDLLIILLGTNDLLQLRTPEQAAAAMEHFLQNLNLQRNRILLLAPPPMVFGEWVQDTDLIEDLVSLEKLYETIATRLGIRYFQPDFGQRMAHDGVHLTEEGHRALAESLFHNMKEGDWFDAGNRNEGIGMFLFR